MEQAQQASPACHGPGKALIHVPGGKASGSRVPVCEALRIDRPCSPDPIQIASALSFRFRLRFFFAPTQRTLDGTRVYSHTEATPDSFDNGHFAVGITQLFHEFQDLVRTLVSTPRTAPPRKQPRKSAGSKTRIRHVESLPADPERMGNVRDCLAINAVSAEHLVSHLHQIPGIKKTVGTEDFVLDSLRMAMEGVLLSKRRES
jgi:hypothetical protein